MESSVCIVLDCLGKFGLDSLGTFGLDCLGRVPGMPWIAMEKFGSNCLDRLPCLGRKFGFICLANVWIVLRLVLDCLGEFGLDCLESLAWIALES